jgi:hypothetical protein
MTVQKKGVFEHRYDEIGFGSVTEIERTRAVDFQIKNLPVGQMQVLTTDNRLGTLHMHMHIRRPQRYRLASFEPSIYPRLQRPNSRVNGANLRFRNADLARKAGRTYGRRTEWP